MQPCYALAFIQAVANLLFFSDENLNLISSWINYVYPSGAVQNYNLYSQNMILAYSIQVVADYQVVTILR